jgi:hypothetical protein
MHTYLTVENVLYDYTHLFKAFVYMYEVSD